MTTAVMETETKSKRWLAARRAMEIAAVTGAFWLLAAALQWKAGAFAAEFGSNPDEPAHYVTGLMIRDFVATGSFAHPREFAVDYYTHYPKVAFGMWPPFFHCVEAVWMLLFSPGRTSVVLLMSLITAALGASLYWLLCENNPRPVALAAGAALVLLPITQAATAGVMADSMVALLDFWAMIWLVRYVKQERTKDAILFGLLAGMALATKANGVALVLLPLTLILLTRRFRLLRRSGLYWSGLIVLVVGGPWQYISFKLIRRSLLESPFSASHIIPTAWLWGRHMLESLGYGLAVFCLIGMAMAAWTARRRPMDVTLAGALALILSVWAYHSVITAYQWRYVLAVIPPLLMVAVAGFRWAADHLPVRAPLAVRAGALGTLAAVAFAAQTGKVDRKPHLGFDQAAQFLTQREFSDGDFLVVSDEMGEGAFVSEVAMRDDRPGHMVLRATKILGTSTWYGLNFSPRYPDAKALRDFLDQAPIQAILVDTRPLSVKEDGEVGTLAKMVLAAIQSDPVWRSREQFPQPVGSGAAVKLYTREGPEPAGSVQLDMRYTLGKDVVLSGHRKPGHSGH